MIIDREKLPFNSFIGLDVFLMVCYYIQSFRLKGYAFLQYTLWLYVYLVIVALVIVLGVFFNSKVEITKPTPARNFSNVIPFLESERQLLVLDFPKVTIQNNQVYPMYNTTTLPTDLFKIDSGKMTYTPSWIITTHRVIEIGFEFLQAKPQCLDPFEHIKLQQGYLWVAREHLTAFWVDFSPGMTFLPVFSMGSHDKRLSRYRHIWKGVEPHQYKAVKDLLISEWQISSEIFHAAEKTFMQKMEAVIFYTFSLFLLPLPLLLMPFSNIALFLYLSIWVCYMVPCIWFIAKEKNSEILSKVRVESGVVFLTLFILGGIILQMILITFL